MRADTKPRHQRGGMSKKQIDMFLEILRKELRKSSQTVLAKRLGCGQSNISSLLAGRHRPSLGLAMDLCRVAGVDPVSTLGIGGRVPLDNEPFAADVLSALFENESLEDWIMDHREAMRISDMVRVLAAWDQTPPSERHDRKPEPRIGWDAFVRNVIAKQSV